MVIDDINYRELLSDKANKSRNKKMQSGEHVSEPNWVKSLASPADRLAAWVADFIIFMPVITLIVAPLRRQATEAQMIGNEQAWLIALLGLGAVSASTLILYHAFFLALWGATPGKKFFGLRVVPAWGSEQTLAPSAGLFRALALILEMACGGIPLLAVFGDDRRRPLHDRIADTVVITTRAPRAVGKASVGEKSMASGFLMAFFVAVAFVCSAQLIHLMRNHTEESDRQFARLEDSGSLCKIVGKSQRGWVPEKGQKKPSRLDVALTLFAASEIDSDCLATEAEYALWHDEQEADNKKSETQAEAYLARGLAESESNPQSAEYLKKACAGTKESDPCRVVQLMKTVDDLNSDDEPSSAEDALARETREQKTALLIDEVTENSSPYLQVWMSEYLLQTNQHARALTLIEHLSAEATLSHFALNARGQALWKLGKLNEARLTARAAIETSGVEQRIETARWLCQVETSTAGCSDESRRACSLLSAAVDQNSESLAHDEILVAYLRGEQCEGNGLALDRLSEIEHQTTSADAREYIDGLKLLAKNKKAESVSAFEKLGRKMVSGPFVTEANWQLVALADSVEKLKPVQATWREADSTEDAWRNLGSKLIEKFNSLGAWNRTLEVGLKMAEVKALDIRSREAMVVAAYHSGQMHLASSMLSTLANEAASGAIPSRSAVSREPASISDFQEVARILSEPVKSPMQHGNHQ